MSAVVMLSVLFFSALVQALIHTTALLGFASIPVLTGVVIYYGLTRARGVALGAAFLAGLFHDALSAIPLGFSSFCFCLVVEVINRFRNEVFISDWITHVLFGAIVNLLLAGLLYILLWQLSGVQIPAAALFVKMISSLLLGGLIVPVVFVLTDALYHRLGIEYRRGTA
jgi:rod shape-determining protein MreD